MTNIRRGRNGSRNERPYFLVDVFLPATTCAGQLLDFDQLERVEPVTAERFSDLFTLHIADEPARSPRLGYQVGAVLSMVCESLADGPLALEVARSCLWLLRTTAIELEYFDGLVEVVFARADDPRQLPLGLYRCGSEGSIRC